MIKIYKNTLDKIESKEQIKMLVPIIMISVAQKFYGGSAKTEDFGASIDLMWTLVTKGKKSLTKRERDNLVELFKDFLHIDKELTFDEELILNKIKDEGAFIMVSIDDIVTIFNGEKRLDKIANSFAILLGVHSYFDGYFIDMSKDELIQEVKHQYAGDDMWKKEKPQTWFVHYTSEELEEIARHFVAFPNVEDLTSRRYNDDSNPFDSQLLARVNFDKYMKALEEMGIICKVSTKYGTYGNKAVFCRVEHKEVVEALYSRLEKIAEIAKENKSEDEEIEEEQETQSNVIPLRPIPPKPVVPKHKQRSWF